MTPFGIHAAGQHMAVIAVGGDDRVALLERRLDADDDGFLADIEVAETADQPHAVELARLLLEAADQEHVAVVAQHCRAVRAVIPCLAFGQKSHRVLPALMGFGRSATALWTQIKSRISGNAIEYNLLYMIDFCEINWKIVNWLDRRCPLSFRPR